MIPHDHGLSTLDTFSVCMKEQIVVPQLTRKLNYNSREVTPAEDLGSQRVAAKTSNILDCVDLIERGPPP